MSKKNGFSMLEAITPKVRLLPPARFRAWRLGWYLSSSIAFSTRARVEVFTTLALFSTRDTVAVDTFARRATCSRFMSESLFYPSRNPDQAVSAYRGVRHKPRPAGSDSTNAEPQAPLVSLPAGRGSAFFVHLQFSYTTC